MTDSFNSSRKAQPDALRTARQIVIDEDVWLVYELPPPPFDRRSAPSLVFENESVIRRVRNFPAHWRNLDDETLFALSWGV